MKDFVDVDVYYAFLNKIKYKCSYNGTGSLCVTVHTTLPTTTLSELTSGFSSQSRHRDKFMVFPRGLV